MTAANFIPSLAFTLKFEGGFSTLRADPGNWTGGRVGVGSLKGTNKGIAASSHPTLDIRHLTDEQIAAIYRKEYWDSIAADNLPAGVDLIAFDIAVNMGAGRVRPWLAQTAGLSPRDRIKRLDALRCGFWRRLRTFPIFGRGWLRRETACLAAALKLA